MSGLSTAGFDWSLALWTVAVGTVANIACAMLGCYLVLRRMSLLGDAISHAVLPGIAVGFLMAGRLASGPIFVGAVGAGLVTALLAHTLHRFGKVPEDSSLGAVFTSLFALGIILINLAPHADLDPGCVLYGLIEFTPLDTVDVLGGQVPRALFPLGAALAATVVFVTLFWKELKVCSFDPALATAMGIPASLIHYLLMAMVAVMTVAAFEAVGSILVVAMLIVPAATAQLMTDRLGLTMLWATAVGVLAAVGGYLAAESINTSIAGMMAATAGGLFATAVLLAPRHGLVSKAWHNLALSLRIAREDALGALYRAAEKGTVGKVHTQAALDAAGAGLIGRLARLQLRWLGLATTDKEALWKLTPQGLEVARSLVRSHRLWEAYLGEHFDLPLDHLHAAASRVEHFIGPRLQEALSDELKGRETDPHGRPIPQRPGA